MNGKLKNTEVLSLGVFHVMKNHFAHCPSSLNQFIL